MGKPAILSIIAGKTKTDLPCTIIGESDATLRVRLDDEWDVEIYKEMILAVYALSVLDMEGARRNPHGPNELV